MSILTILLGLLPGFAWLFFYLQEDIHPEPRRLIAKTFLFGALSATAAIFIQHFLNSWFGLLNFKQFIFVALLILALVEELVKFFAAYLSIHKNVSFDEPVDAMIYTVVAALGFATIENIGAAVGASPGFAGVLNNVFITTSLRFIGATLLHALASAFVGYSWAYGIRRFNSKKYILYGIVIATVLHAVFNFFIINLGGIVYPVILLVIAGFFVLSDFEKLKRKGV